MAFTNGFSFFNTNYSNLKLCYFNQIGCIEIANVFDKFRGKKPKKGMVMYDYDNKGKFWLHIEDVLAISQNWEALVNGEYDFEKISEGGTREMTTKLTIGRGLYQVGEEKVKKSKAPFQISIESYDEYDENSEPINSYIYSSADSDTELKIFKIYIDVLLQFVMSGIANHIASCSLQNNDRNGGGEYNKFSRTPRYSRNNKNDDDDNDEDFAPTRNRGNGGERNNKFSKRNRNNDSPDEDETFNEDDE